jgi:hypothetical protein
MVFDLEADPHEQHNLAAERPDLVDKGKAILHDWRVKMRGSARHTVDPLDTVMAEGGPFHIQEARSGAYLERLRSTGRAEIAERFATREHPYRSE